MKHCLDLRKVSAGGWGASKMEAKVNGRWTYFFEAEKNKPFNHKEPIGFGQKYKPPNHRKETFSNYPQYVVHPKRELYIQSKQKQRAPFLFAQSNQETELKQTLESSNPEKNSTAELFITKSNENNVTKSAPKVEPSRILPSAWERRNCLTIKEENEANILPTKRFTYSSISSTKKKRNMTSGIETHVVSNRKKGIQQSPQSRLSTLPSNEANIRPHFSSMLFGTPSEDIADEDFKFEIKPLARTHASSPRNSLM